MISDLVLLLSQIGVILISARLVGWGLRTLHQPQVMGEIVAGILLGPSLLGRLVPDVSVALFPSGSLGALNTLGEVGVLLFIFGVGLKLDLANVWARGRAVLVIAHASIAVPLILGAGLAIYLYPFLSDTEVTPTVFALFTGVAMSVTALPVLARILEECRLSETPLGTVALAIAALKDVMAWCLLAGVMTLHTYTVALEALVLKIIATGLFVFAMLRLVPRIFHFLEARSRHGSHLADSMWVLMLLTMAGSAWITERFGVHALFGAFLAGVALSKSPVMVSKALGKFEGLTSAILLPIFFASVGLRTNFDLIHGTQLWIYVGLILLVAVVGMWGGTTLAARCTGMSWPESTMIGILMNTRGLMEIVILTIGRDIGMISSTMFAMMLLMTLVTTCMTTPLLRWYRPDQARPTAALQLEMPDRVKNSQ
ncbi:MAG TPA: cation:proton antiporter [Nitrospira sp.]